MKVIYEAMQVQLMVAQSDDGFEVALRSGQSDFVTVPLNRAQAMNLAASINRAIMASDAPGGDVVVTS